MKTDRLIGILSVLLQKEKCTAPELAEKFEVSRRTVNRDIETLCRAGIPVCTVQGAGGGICIMDGYKIDRTLLTSRDMQMILAGLRSLDSVSGRDSILIDLSSWYKESLAPKISLIRDGIEERKLIAFHYFAPGGESIRRVEPYYLIFKWSSWYVWGWCKTREDFRLFKLNRMTELDCGEAFSPRPAPLPDLEPERVFPVKYKVTVLFDPACRWRLVEEYGPDSFTTEPDGRLRFTGGFPDADSVLSWVLTFGDKAELLEPNELRRRLCDLTNTLAARYAL